MEGNVILDSSVRFRELDGEGVVVNQANAEILLVNGVGVDVLQRIGSEKPLVDLIEEIATQYKVDLAVVKNDVECYIDELQAAGIVTVFP